jgi:COP9 signalosome complex subunit 7
MQEDFAALHRITEAPVAGSSISSAKPAQSASAPVAASNKLEPFLVLARSARGPGAAALVVDQVISASGVFSFGELLDVKAIVEVRDALSVGLHCNTQ